MRKLFINFDNPSAIYFGGQNVTGHVILDLTQSSGHLKVKEIRLDYQGNENVEWKQQEETETLTGDTEHTYYVPVSQGYSNAKCYFDSSQVLCEKVTLDGGKSHFFPFQFSLPENCATTFVGELGSIRYSCHVKLKESTFFKGDTGVTRPFTVIGVQDLNKDPEAIKPAEASKHHSLGVLFMKAGDITVEASLPKTGYVAGETIPISLNVINESKRAIKNIEAQLKQKITFTATWDGHDDTKSKKAIVTSISRKPDPNAGDSVIWQNEPLRIPAVPNNLVNASHIAINYCLKICVHPSGLSKTLKLKLPIIIGTVPLRHQFPALQMSHKKRIEADQAAGYSAPSAPIAAMPPSAPPMGIAGASAPSSAVGIQPYYSDCPPPSYSELHNLQGDQSNAEEDSQIKGNMYPNLCSVNAESATANPNAAEGENVERKITPGYTYYHWD